MVKTLRILRAGGCIRSLQWQRSYWSGIRRADDGRRHRPEYTDRARRSGSVCYTGPGQDPDEAEDSEAALQLPPAVSGQDDPVYQLHQLVPRRLRVGDGSSAAETERSVEWAVLQSARPRSASRHH